MKICHVPTGGSKFPTKCILDRKNDRVWLNVIPADGFVRRIPTFPGEIMAEALVRYNIPGIQMYCQGGDPNYPVADAPMNYLSEGPSCEGCHVIIHEKWFNKMYVSYQEKGRLGSLSFPTAKTSRFSCCIKMKEYMNDMIVLVGPDIGSDVKTFP